MSAQPPVTSHPVPPPPKPGVESPSSSTGPSTGASSWEDVAPPETNGEASNQTRDQASDQDNGEASAQVVPLHPLLQLLADDFKVPAEKLHNLQENDAPLALSELKQRLQAQKIAPPELCQQALAKLLGLEFRAHLDDAEIDAEFARHIPIHYAKKFQLFPHSIHDNELLLAVANPDADDAISDIERRFGKPVRLLVSTPQSILTLINRAYDRSVSEDQDINDLDASLAEGGPDWTLEEPEDLIDAQDEEPIKRLLNNLLYRAARTNASDMHVDATAAELIIRFRVDGVLREASALPKGIQRTLINRIKVMSRLDISQRGLPQDGRTLILIAGRKIDIRVSTLPTVHGEKAVMRLLYQDQSRFDLTELGMPQAIRQHLRELARQSGGIILVSGPTGSGKTTTLYAVLNEIDRHSKNVMTIEDPVEYKLPGYVQTEVNPKLGLTFASTLRSVLRQDPDVIMVGEMRDQETALIAIQAALTGHTVFSTVHTNDAPSTVTRLVDMGIEPYLVSSTVVAVLAQRLVRRICAGCREQTTHGLDTLPLFTRDATRMAQLRQRGYLYQGKGCAACRGSGYAGRIGVFELLLMSEAVKKVLLRTNEANQIREAALADGMESMRSYGLSLAERGVTTLDELFQVSRDG